VSQVLNWTATISGGANWFTLSRSGGSTPGSFNVTLTSAALSLSSNGSPYSSAIAVTCTSGACAGKAQNVSVTLNVPASPPQLTVGPTPLAFTALSTNPAASTQSLSLSNTGGGTLGIGSVTCAASWCNLGGVPAQLTGGQTQSVSVTADPGSLKAGFY